jgi:hypothetical protein
MIHFQSDVIIHLADNNLAQNGKPIINIGDLIVFSEENPNSKSYIAYDTFFKLVDMYFEYVEAGTKEHRTIKVTGLLTKFQI